MRRKGVHWVNVILVLLLSLLLVGCYESPLEVRDPCYEMVITPDSTYFVHTPGECTKPDSTTSLRLPSYHS